MTSKNFVAFRNKGEIDPRSITTFGVSSKENSSAIGYFGTGLKYAISILLREGCSISIYSGLQEMEFGTRLETVRVDEFTFVTMNGEALGFTTELGKNWETWQAFREIYCNTLDEQGEFFECSDHPDPQEGETLIVVSGDSIMEAWNNRHSIVLDSEPKLVIDGLLEVREGRSDSIYYKGIKAYSPGRSTLYTYNILCSMELTEDRTFKHGFMADHYIAQGCARMTHKGVIQGMLLPPEGAFETGLSFDGMTPTDEFKAVVRLGVKQFAGINRSAVKACQLDILQSLDSEESMQLTPTDKARLDKAVAFCKSIGFQVDEYPIVVSEFLGEGVLGRAYNERIFISHRTMMTGTKQVAGTLIEEFLHLRHKLVDKTYGMQNFLFDALVSMGEQLTGDVL